MSSSLFSSARLLGDTTGEARVSVPRSGRLPAANGELLSVVHDRESWLGSPAAFAEALGAIDGARDGGGGIGGGGAEAVESALVRERVR